MRNMLYSPQRQKGKDSGEDSLMSADKVRNIVLTDDVLCTCIQSADPFLNK